MLSLAADGRALTIEWPGGERRTFRAIWLRDNCPCAECEHASGQRLLDTASIPADLAVASAELEGDVLEITWTGDGHVSSYPLEWLSGLGASPRGRTLWDASLAGRLPAGRYVDVASRATALRDWLGAIDELGFALLHGVPVADGEVARVAELFGYVRETNYGRVFDVRSVVAPNNLAYTGLALGAHTDNPYREPTPTLQLLHCLSSSAAGGESTLVDGFAAAARLKAEDADAFELLATQPVRFRFRDADTELEREAPVIGLDVRGDVVAIRFNNRSKAPLELRDELVEPYYAAYRSFAELLESPDLQVGFALEPGDLFVVDNERVLHGRTGFSGEGRRHLQGCYADRDGLRSRLGVLRRRTAVIDEIFEQFRVHGNEAYLGEPVSLTEHMLQTAAAAEQDGADPILVAAALLHDYGHLIHDLPEDSAEHGVDTRHEEVGFDFLAQHFVPEAVEPVRMHVAAKRYLCAVEPSYLEELSPASILSLELQGGPCSPEEVREFEASPHVEAAVRLRRYDDVGKIEGLETPDLEHYRPYLETALKP
jgi:gamma-butyrobetaine dioxygenase